MSSRSRGPGRTARRPSATAPPASANPRLASGEHERARRRRRASGRCGRRAVRRGYRRRARRRRRRRGASPASSFVRSYVSAKLGRSGMIAPNSIASRKTIDPVTTTTRRTRPRIRSAITLPELQVSDRSRTPRERSVATATAAPSGMCPAKPGIKPQDPLTDGPLRRRCGHEGLRPRQRTPSGDVPRRRRGSSRQDPAPAGPAWRNKKKRTESVLASVQLTRSTAAEATAGRESLQPSALRARCNRKAIRDILTRVKHHARRVSSQIATFIVSRAQ